MDFAPKTYWEERTLAAEGALERLMQIVAMALPHTGYDINEVHKEWGRIMNDIKRDHEQVSNAK